MNEGETIGLSARLTELGRRPDAPKRQQLRMHGHMHAVLRHKDGTEEVFEKDNLIVDAGFDFICDAIGNASQPTSMGYIAVGTSNTAADSAQTALGAEVERKAATYAHDSGSQTFTMSSTFDAGEGTGALTEAGIFNDPSAGTMLDRVVFPVINKGADDVLTQTFTFTLS